MDRSTVVREVKDGFPSLCGVGIGITMATDDVEVQVDEDRDNNLRLGCELTSRRISHPNNNNFRLDKLEMSEVMVMECECECESDRPVQVVELQLEKGDTAVATSSKSISLADFQSASQSLLYYGHQAATSSASSGYEEITILDILQGDLIQDDNYDDLHHKDTPKLGPRPHFRLMNHD